MCSASRGWGQSTANETSTIMMSIPSSPATMNNNAKTNEEMVLALKLYRENLTYPRNRIPENILLVTDPAFPEISITREQARADLIASRHLLPADDAISRFNLMNTPGQALGDQVFLTVYVYPNTSTHILDTVVTNISNRKEIFHVVEAWVDVKNLEKLASMDGVRGMKLVEYADHSD